MKTVEPEKAKHAKISTAPKHADLPEIEDYERPELEQFEKPEFEQAERSKKVFVLYIRIFYAFANQQRNAAHQECLRIYFHEVRWLTKYSVLDRSSSHCALFYAAFAIRQLFYGPIHRTVNAKHFSGGVHNSDISALNRSTKIAFRRCISRKFVRVLFSRWCLGETVC